MDRIAALAKFNLSYSNPQELFGGYDGVNLLIECLTQDLTKFSSGLGHNRLLLAAVDCTWLGHANQYIQVMKKILTKTG